MKRNTNIMIGVVFLLILALLYAWTIYVKSTKALPIETVVQSGHYGPISHLAVTPDGKYVVSCDYSRAILWDIKTGKEIRSFSGHSFLGEITACQITSDGKYLFTSGRDNKTIMWDINTGNYIKKFDTWGHYLHITSDNKYLILNNIEDKYQEIFDINTGKKITIYYSGEYKYAASLAVTSDGKYLVVGSIRCNTWVKENEDYLYDTSAKLYDLGTGKKIRSFDAHSKKVSSVAISPDNKYIATASYDKTIKLWDIETGREIKTFTGHKSKIELVSFTPDNEYLISQNDYGLKVWHIKSGNCIADLDGHYRYNRFGQPFGLSADGKDAVIISDTISVLWNLESGKQIRKFIGHKGQVNSNIITPDNKYVITGGSDNAVKIWDIKTGKEIRTLDSHDTTVKYRYSISDISKDNKYLITNNIRKDHKSRTKFNTVLFDIKSNKMINLDIGKNYKLKKYVVFDKYYCSFSDSAIYVFDIKTKQLIKKNYGDADIAALAVSRDNKLLFAYNKNNTVTVWDTDFNKVKEIALKFDFYTEKMKSAMRKKIEKYYSRKINNREDDINECLSDTSPWTLRQPLDTKSYSKADSYSIISMEINILNNTDTLYFTGVTKYCTVFDYDSNNVESHFNKQHTYEFTFTFNEFINFIGNIYNTDTALILKDINQFIKDNHIKIVKFDESLIKQINKEFKFKRMQLSSDGEYLSLHDYNGFNLFYNIITDSQTFLISNNYGNSFEFCSHIVTNNTGDKIIITNNDGKIKYYNLKNSINLMTLKGLKNIVHYLTVSPDGKYLFAIDRDNTAKLWDIKTSKEIITYNWNHGILNVFFTNDNKYLICSSFEGKIFIYETLTGKEIASLIYVGENDWAVVTPEGYFDCSEGAKDYIHFVKGLEVYPLNQFYKKFYRQGLLTQILEDK